MSNDIIFLLFVGGFIFGLLILSFFDGYRRPAKWQKLKVSKVYEKKSGEWVRIYSDGDDL